ncbi:MAG: hypothetical protein IIV28_05415, partial [Alistipes sp.]|nr:hypothetical protein [Alistipes sp.]
MTYLRLWLVALALLCSFSAAAQEVTPSDTTQLTRAERINGRGLTNLKNTFVPKGHIIAGAALSYSTHLNDSYTFMIVEDIESEGYNFRVSPMVAYAVRDNMAIGVRGAYSRSNLTIDKADLKFGDEETGTAISVTDFKAVKHTYTASAIWRQYIPLGKSKRFALLNEISLGA